VKLLTGSDKTEKFKGDKSVAEKGVLNGGQAIKKYQRD